MSWLGMSIPTLPGTSKRPPSKHPGAENIEREEEKNRQKLPERKGPAERPEIKPVTRRRPPAPSRRKP